MRVNNLSCYSLDMLSRHAKSNHLLFFTTKKNYSSNKYRGDSFRIKLSGVTSGKLQKIFLPSRENEREKKGKKIINRT